jgi:hypothetical protein
VRRRVAASSLSSECASDRHQPHLRKPSQILPVRCESCCSLLGEVIKHCAAPQEMELCHSLPSFPSVRQAERSIVPSLPGLQHIDYTAKLPCSLPWSGQGAVSLTRPTIVDTCNSELELSHLGTVHQSYQTTSVASISDDRQLRCDAYVCSTATPPCPRRMVQAARSGSRTTVQLACAQSRRVVFRGDVTAAIGRIRCGMGGGFVAFYRVSREES